MSISGLTPEHRARAEAEAANLFLREILEDLTKIIGLPLTNETGEPARNYQLLDGIKSALHGYREVIDDLWANIENINNLEPGTIAICQDLHEQLWHNGPDNISEK